MPHLPPFREIRRHAPLVGASFVLSQLPALPLLLFGKGLGTPALGLYALASVATALGLVSLGVAWCGRIERIVSLVRAYAEDGRLPKAGHGTGGCEEQVTTSLATLDGIVRSLEAEAARDPLTGILNRRTCAARLEGDLARSRRSGVPFSLALFDLDDLKGINDGLGHAAGDEALRSLAEVLKSVVREGDWVARWGGDEFLVGFWAAEGPAALVAVGRAIERLADGPKMLGDGRATLGASVGVAEALPHEDASCLFSRADAALFESKRAGRGRVSLSSR